MGTSGYQRVHVVNPFGSELGSATRLAKWPISEATDKAMEVLEASIENEPELAIPRLAAKKTERSLAARFESLVAVSAVIGTHHDIKGLFSALARSSFDWSISTSSAYLDT